ncbi:MAG: mechanosensitive ion channel [Epsilonproteobacteria bacterium]|nr:mechanosensitive ion channel [Campylobacterota bacterium]
MGDLLTTLPVEWKTWGALIVFGLPLAIIIAGELLLFLEKKESEFIPIVYNIRNILLPNLAIYLILSKIMKLGDDSLLLKISATFFWLVLIHSALKFVNTLVFSEALPSQVRDRIPKLLVDFSRTFLVLLGAAIIASNVWGADLGRLLAALGVGSVVLGLALQDVLGGLFSGIALLSSKPFTVGDWIKVGDVNGQVKNIDWRAVTLVDFNGDSIVIPNAVIAKEKFRNYSRPSSIHRESVGFDISFDDPPNKVKQVLLEAAYDTKGILREPAPQVALISYDEFSIHYEIRYFINDYGEVATIHNNFISKVWYANRRYGITFPTRAHEVYNFDGVSSAEQPQTPKEIKDLIKASKALPVAEHELLELAKHCTIDDFGVGECLLQKGLLTDKVYLILEGVAREHVENKNGHLLHEGRLKRGDMFGLSSLVRKEPSIVTVCAISDIKVISIDIEAMQTLLQHNPEVAQSLENVADTHEEKVSKSIFLNQSSLDV